MDKHPQAVNVRSEVGVQCASNCIEQKNFIEYTKVELHGNGVVSLRLNQPDTLNCLGQKMLRSLDAALESCERSKSARVVILSASGKHFSAGADIRQLGVLTDSALTGECGHSLPQILQRFRTLPIPTVAVVQGAAIGGGAALVACADIVIAEKSAFFAIPEVRLGIPPAALIPFLVAALGERQARRYVLTGERINAEDATRHGLVHLICDEGGLEEAAASVAASLANGGPRSLAEAKRLIGEIGSSELGDDRLAELEQIALKHMAAPEAQEGIAAYLEKRRPVWQFLGDGKGSI